MMDYSLKLRTDMNPFLPKLLLFYNYFYVYNSFAYIYIYALCACLEPTEGQRRHSIPRIGVIENCACHVTAENKTRIHWKNSQCFNL